MDSLKCHLHIGSLSRIYTGIAKEGLYDECMARTSRTVKRRAATLQGTMERKTGETACVERGFMMQIHRSLGIHVCARSQEDADGFHVASPGSTTESGVSTCDKRDAM